MEGIEWNHFITILLLDPYFKINSWIYSGILRVLVKKIIKFNFIPPPPQFLPILRGMKNWGFKRIERNECSLLPIPFPPT